MVKAKVMKKRLAHFRKTGKCPCCSSQTATKRQRFECRKAGCPVPPQKTRIKVPKTTEEKKKARRECNKRYRKKLARNKAAAAGESNVMGYGVEAPPRDYRTYKTIPEWAKPHPYYELSYEEQVAQDNRVPRRNWIRCTLCYLRWWNRMHPKYPKPI